jgi:ferrous iron transport protein B
LRVLDLPGAYSLSAHTPDEAITRDVVAGLRAGEQAPDAVVCVVNATNLRLNLRLVLEIQRLGLPMVLALNMVDVAKKRGIEIDTAKLAQELGMPVVETVAVQAGGEKKLLARARTAAFDASRNRRAWRRSTPCRSRRPSAKCAASSRPASASTRTPAT